MNISEPILTENVTEYSDISASISNDTRQISESFEDKELARIVNLVIRPVLIVFGTIGNGLSFYIMRQGSLMVYSH